MSNFYISDTHFGHVNIVTYDTRNGGRQFENIEDHDQTIIDNWNKVVTNQDSVYVLGDFSWLYAQQTKEIIEKLNGQKFLVKGNHDRWSKDGACKKLFQAIYDYKEIDDNGKRVILSHYPIMMWNGQHRGAIHLYGHVHNTKEETDYQGYLGTLNHNLSVRDERFKGATAINVGACMKYMDYTPRRLDELV